MKRDTFGAVLWCNISVKVPSVSAVCHTDIVLVQWRTLFLPLKVQQCHEIKMPPLIRLCEKGSNVTHSSEAQYRFTKSPGLVCIFSVLVDYMTAV